MTFNGSGFVSGSYLPSVGGAISEWKSFFSTNRGFSKTKPQCLGLIALKSPGNTWN